MTNIKQKISEVEKEIENLIQVITDSEGTANIEPEMKILEVELQTLKSCEEEDEWKNKQIENLNIQVHDLLVEITKLQEEEKAKVEKLKKELYKGDKTLRDSAIKISFNQIEIIIDKIFSQEETGEKLI